MRRRGSLLVGTLLLGLVASGCTRGHEGPVVFSGIPRPTAPPTNIVEQLEQDELGRFTTLLDLVAPTAPAGASAGEVAADKAVTEANAELVELLTGTGPVTIFAPTNTAFAVLGVTGGPAQGHPAALSAILSLHVVEQDVSFAEPPYVTDGLVDGRTKPEDAGLVIVSDASTCPAWPGPTCCSAAPPSRCPWRATVAVCRSSSPTCRRPTASSRSWTGCCCPRARSSAPPLRPPPAPGPDPPDLAERPDLTHRTRPNDRTGPGTRRAPPPVRGSGALRVRGPGSPGGDHRIT